MSSKPNIRIISAGAGSGKTHRIAEELCAMLQGESGRPVRPSGIIATTFTVKAAGELKAPVDGTVLEINEILADEPERVNNDAMGDGWFMRLRVTDAGDIDELMDEDDYQSYIEGLG